MRDKFSILNMRIFFVDVPNYKLRLFFVQGDNSIYSGFVDLSNYISTFLIYQFIRTRFHHFNNGRAFEIQNYYEAHYGRTGQPKY